MITKTTSSVTYQGNGATTAFPFAFKIPIGGLVVQITDNTQAFPVVTTLTSNQYSAAGVGGDETGGTVTYPLSGNPLPVGFAITISRQVSITQTTSFPNQGGFYPQNHEAALDNLAMICQQNAQAIALTVQVPVGSTLTPAGYLTAIQTAANGATASAATATAGANTATNQAIAASGSAASAAASAAAALAAAVVPFNAAAAAGTVDAITATFAPAITLADKTICTVYCAGANTSTAPTFAPNGLTAHPITKQGGQALAAGDIPRAGFVALLQYDSANNRWELLNPGGTVTIPINLTSAANAINAGMFR